jgi:serine protease Do
MLKDNKLRFRNWVFWIGFASLFVLVGIIIATNLELPAKLGAAVNKPLSKNPYSGDYRSPFVYVAEKVSPAVVNISAKSIEEGTGRYHQRGLPFDDEFFRRFFGVPQPQEKKKWETQSLGSGFIYTPDGYILTNNHVITGGGSKEADKISVTLADGSNYRAELVGRDPETDIAILKIDAKRELLFAELGDSDSIHVGEWAIAIGNPFPQYGLDRTLTVGVISATGRKGLFFGGEVTPTFQDYVQTDAAINPGNSGGPLVNIDGKVIGINAAITTPSGGNVGIGFAIPINLVKQITPQLTKTGTVSRGYLGIGPRTLSADLAEALKVSGSKGVLVETVQPGTPAEEAGLKTGDVITTFDGKSVADEDQFRKLVAATEPGKKVKLDVLRSGKEQVLTVQLAERPSLANNGEPQRDEGTEEAWMGLSVRTANPALAEQYGVQFDQGVIVTEVEPGSPADDKGIQTGDLITKIDGRKVSDLNSYRQIVKILKKTERAVSVLVVRGEEGITRFFALKASD